MKIISDLEALLDNNKAFNFHQTMSSELHCGKGVGSTQSLQSDGIIIKFTLSLYSYFSLNAKQKAKDKYIAFKILIYNARSFTANTDK